MTYGGKKTKVEVINKNIGPFTEYREKKLLEKLERLTRKVSDLVHFLCAREHKNIIRK